MCLKKFVKFTFSNKEAFERLDEILSNEYGKYTIKGEIIAINGYKDYYRHAQIVKKNRNDYPYDELMELLGDFSPVFTDWGYYFIYSWDDWHKTRELLKDKEDIFGEVTIELQ